MYLLQNVFIIHIYISNTLESTPCYWGFHKNGLCWVWASGDTLTGSPFGEWRPPTEEEWSDRPSWTELADHCLYKTFDGSECSIKSAQEKGDVCFCRAKGCIGSQFCDLMYVKTAGM